MHEHGLICSIDAGHLILNFRSKMADWWEIRIFQYLTYGSHSEALSQYCVAEPGHIDPYRLPVVP